MSEVREVPTRQPRPPSRGAELANEQSTEEGVQLSPEEALAEAQEARRIAEEQRDAAQAREAAVARERDEARGGEQKATGDALSARERSILSEINTQNSAIQAAKTGIANAQAAGDAVAVADAFDQLADARAKLGRLTEQKEWFDAERERLKDQPQQQRGAPAGTHRVQTPGGPLDLDAETKAWADRHPRFYSDADYYNQAINAHQTARASGAVVGGALYFRALDEAMTKYERYEAFERGELRQEGQQMTQRRQPPASSMAAPVTRGAVNPSRNSGQPSATVIAAHIGVTAQDLQDMAKVNGFKAGKGYKTDAEGFTAYLKEQQDIIDIERVGGDTGLRHEGQGVYK
jgi:hypothetical protein